MPGKEIRVSGIHIARRENGKTRLSARIEFSGMESPFVEREMWFESGNELKGAFLDSTYDPFLLVPMYLAMYYGATLRVEGKVSKRLYDNMVRYGQSILCEFSDDLRHVPVEVEGFTSPLSMGVDLIGTGISCGVDSLSTIKDRFVDECNADYRINGLCLFNCGTHGDYGKETTSRQFDALLKENGCAAQELGLPLYSIDSNLHAFTHEIGEQKMGYFAIYSCALSIQGRVKRYYMSSSYSYGEQLRFHEQAHDFDMAEFCEGLIVPLVQTESFELVLDGAQYRRSQKVENIVDWEIARRYLNVCVNSNREGENCSVCPKCKRTLLALEALGRLEAYSGLFDIEKYRKIAPRYKLEIVADYGREGFTTDGVDFAHHCGLPMPSRPIAAVSMIPMKISRRLRRFLKRVLSFG